nr:MAG TPA: hypothetical protein [Caudoviricetes sp.]
MTLSITSYPVCNLKGEYNAMYSPFSFYPHGLNESINNK